MLFPTVRKIQIRFEEYIARLEIVAATISDISMKMPLTNALMGESPELKTLAGRCAQVHGLLSGAMGELFANRVTPRELAVRLPKIDREVREIEGVTEAIRKSMTASRVG